MTLVEAEPRAIERRPIKDRAEWLAWRLQDVTASDVGALFGRHPYGRSALSLWAEKAGLTDSGLADNPTLRRGRWGEAAVLEMLADERPTWTISRPKVYLRDPGVRLGGTPDAEAIDPEREGLGIVQTKTVTRYWYERDWPDGEPPIGFQLQTLVEMLLAGAAWGVIAALVLDGGEWEPVIFPIERHEPAEARIRAATIRFWRDFDAGLIPVINPALDAATVDAIYRKGRIHDPLDLSGDAAIVDALDKRAVLEEVIKSSQKRVEPLDTLIKARLAEHTRAITPRWRISWKNEPRKAHSVKASDPRVLRISPAREG
jgi:predicted phage-related endonuclease